MNDSCSAQSCLKKLWSCPVAVSLGIALVSILALAAAFTAQFALKMEPCILCLYQRIPYAIAIALGLAGLALRENKNAVSLLVALAALAFFIDAGLALYHVGVEQKWWVSAVEGCRAPQFASNEGLSVLDQLLKTPSVSCDQVAWRDPVLRISMAGWNVMLCAFLAVNCAVASRLIKRRP